MVKRKASAPQRIADENRRTRSWNLNDSSVSSNGTQRLLLDEHATSPDDDGDDNCSRISSTNSDVDVQYTAGSVGTVKRRRGKKYNLRPLNDDLQVLVDACDFFLYVRAASGDEPDDAVGLLGTLEFRLEGERDVLMKPSGCWMYVGQLPSRSFVYYEWEHRDGKGVDGQCPNCGPLTLQKNETLHAIHSLIRPEGMPDYDLLRALNRKKYAIQLKPVDDDANGKFELDVYLLESALSKLTHPSFTYDCKNGKKVVTVMRHFLRIPRPDDEASAPRTAKSDIDQLYDAVKHYHAREAQESVDFDVVHVQHPSLLPTLRPYQVDAVRWMLKRERFGRGEDSTPLDRNGLPMHPLFVDVKLGRDGPTLYFNPYGGILTRDEPACNAYFPGGILADEMGLGKTVEVIAGILCNPRPRDSFEKQENLTCDGTNGTISSDAIVKRKPFFECICGVRPSDSDDDEPSAVVQCQKCGTLQHAECVKYDSTDEVIGVDYYCPHCWIIMPRIESRATLIVSPAAIRDQWMDELRKHVDHDSLKILIYEGVHGSGYIQPRALADHDMVIMSYITMRKEIDYVDLPHSNSDQGRRLRQPKRYMAVPSPLVAVEWWRVCLDEAQMVECCMAKTAAMALRLSAVHRWCVTGTPIQKSVNDLYGLVLFLGLDPYCVRYWWKECLGDPHFRSHVQPLHDVISKVLWRSSKADVLEQLALPPQTEKVHWLSFTPVEELFYRRQHSECSVDVDGVSNGCSTLDAKLDSFDRHAVDKWLQLLLRLRQACCHPQVVRGKFVAMRKTSMTMEELLDILTKKAKVECEEQHRQYIAALNGLAAIHIIKKEWREAVENYREVLRSARELRPRIKTDKLPLLHALNNLIEVLDAGHEGIPPTTGDSNLRRDADELSTKYLERCFNKVRDSRDVLAQATAAVEDVSAGNSSKTHWWADVLGWFAGTKHDADLVDRVKQEIVNTGTSHGGAINYSSSFRDCRGLMYVVKRRLDKLHEYRTALSKAVFRLEDRPSAENIDRAVQCHLKRTSTTSNKPKKCVYCDVQDLFNCYESELFSFEKEGTITFGQTDEDDRLGQKIRRGTWIGGMAEQTLKGILAFCRVQEKIPKQWIECGKTQMKLLEALKKEFKGLRGVWMQLTDQVSALDELNMANFRLRVRLPDEPRSNPPRVDILEPGEVDRHRLNLTSERIASRHELSKKLGQLGYVENLSKSDYGKHNPDLCPICRQCFGEQWFVLQCGHCFCVDCVRVLIIGQKAIARWASLKCAVCRLVTVIGEVSYVNTKIDTPEQRDIHVEGSHSTKVEAVVRKLLQIRANEPSSKTLVFSTWPEVLDLLARALKQNKVIFRNLGDIKTFQENVTDFKVDPEVSVLLLPVHTGSNGLNLIEATHVILFEPILNPAHEVQAISRVHRIGQTKPTVVHRFLVRNTIEERMHYVLAKFHDNSVVTGHGNADDNPLTVRDFLDLFRVTPSIIDQ